MPADRTRIAHRLAVAAAVIFTGLATLAAFSVLIDASRHRSFAVAGGIGATALTAAAALWTVTVTLGRQRH